MLKKTKQTHQFRDYGVFKWDENSVSIGIVVMGHLGNLIPILCSIWHSHDHSVETHRNQFHIKGEVAHIHSEDSILKNSYCKRENVKISLWPGKLEQNGKRFNSIKCKLTIDCEKRMAQDRSSHICMLAESVFKGTIIRCEDMLIMECHRIEFMVCVVHHKSLDRGGKNQ